MPDKKIKLLDQLQIDQKIMRIAYQIYEDNCDEKRLIIAGIEKRGYTVAQLITEKLKEISDLEINLVAMKMNKENPTEGEVQLPLEPKDYKNEIIVLVDDVLNSGKTLMHAAAHFLTVPMKRLSTAVLVDRKHRRYPIRADYVGHSLATTMQEHITVEINSKGKGNVYIS